MIISPQINQQKSAYHTLFTFIRLLSHELDTFLGLLLCTGVHQTFDDLRRHSRDTALLSRLQHFLKIRLKTLKEENI